jgi:hypothetical protein
MRKKYLYLVLMASLAIVPLLFAADGTIFTQVGKGTRRDTVDLELREATVGSAPTLYLSGDVKLGDDGTRSITLPTTALADFYSLKVPYYNNSGTTITRGMVVVSSVTAAGTTTAMYCGVTNVLSTTTWVGIADGSVLTGGKGWMSVAGYAAVYTTGTVTVGDMLTSTSGSLGVGAAGYAGRIDGAATVLEGSVIGKAMSNGTAAGGLTIVRIGN